MQPFFSSFHSLCSKGDLTSVSDSVSSELIDTQDPFIGLTGLACAVINGHVELIEYLLEKGASPNISNKMGESPLHYVCDNSQFETAELLLRYGADPNLENNEGETPIFHSAYKGDAATTRLLLEKGADPNAQCKNLGRTPLHYAVIAGHSSCANVLMEHKADLCIKDECGLSPFDLASEDFKQSFLQNLTTHEIGEDTRNLHSFLAFLKLEEHFETLVKAGYDDLDSLVDQMITPVPISDLMLTQIGISKPGHRRKLIVKLHRAAFGNRKNTKKRKTNWYCCKCNRKEATRGHLCNSLEEWLNELRLSKLKHKFESSGFDSIHDIREMMDSPYPVTEFVLREDIGILKPGHRFRILGKLLSEMNNNETRDFGSTESESCSLL